MEEIKLQQRAIGIIEAGLQKVKEQTIKPGDRVHYIGGELDGKTGVVEWMGTFAKVCNVVWEDESRSMVKIKVLEKIHIIIADILGITCPPAGLATNGTRDNDTPVPELRRWASERGTHEMGKRP